MAFFLPSTLLKAYNNPTNNHIAIDINPTHSKKLISYSGFHARHQSTICNHSAMVTQPRTSSAGSASSNTTSCHPFTQSCEVSDPALSNHTATSALAEISGGNALSRSSQCKSPIWAFIFAVIHSTKPRGQHQSIFKGQREPVIITAECPIFFIHFFLHPLFDLKAVLQT